MYFYRRVISSQSYAKASDCMQAQKLEGLLAAALAKAGSETIPYGSSPVRCTGQVEAPHILIENDG